MFNQAISPDSLKLYSLISILGGLGGAALGKDHWLGRLGSAAGQFAQTPIQMDMLKKLLASQEGLGSMKFNLNDLAVGDLLTPDSALAKIK